MSITDKLTYGEIGTAAMSTLICGATDLRYLPFIGLGLVAVGKLRRAAPVRRTISARLASMDYNEDEGTPLAGRLLASIPIDPGTALVRVERPERHDEKPVKAARKPSQRVKRTFWGAIEGFAASVSSQDDGEPVVEQREEPRKERSKPSERVEAEVVDEDEAWLRKAAGSVPGGLEAAPEVLPVREVCERLNTMVDDYPHVFLVGNSGAGKTIFAQLLACTRPGKLVILDQKRPKGWEKEKWGGLPYVARDKQNASYSPMVQALQQVVAEMDRRYRVQDEVTEPFEMLTVVLDEAKNSVSECEELAEYYKKIVSIGREVGIRLILISTSDRARILGFDGEADSMDSFAWVVFGEKACGLQPVVKARGKERYYWAAADFFGSWVPFENEKAFSLVQKLGNLSHKAWDKVTYNCQLPTKQLASKVTRPMQVLDAVGGMAEDDERPVVNGYVYTDADVALLERLTLRSAERSVNDKSPRSGREVTEKGLSTSALGEVQTSRSETGNLRTSLSADASLQEAVLTFKSVPETEREKLRSALKRFTDNGQKVTDAIEHAWGNGGGPNFKERSKWLRAAHTLYLASKK